MVDLTADDLESILSGDPEALDVELALVERDVKLDNCAVRVHCHCLVIDANGRPQPRRLAELMRNAVADYAIPRNRLEQARARDAKYRTTESVGALIEEARGTFTDLSTTGEGGEMLLFLLAERFLMLPHILCKMDLKTDQRVHYHGADGVYAGVTDEGILKLFWGESKVHGDPAKAIRECLKSLAPFIIEEDHEGADRERDLMLLSDKADLSDPNLTDALKRYFDRSKPEVKKVKYCGVALAGFDADFYPQDDPAAITDDVVAAAREALSKWQKQISKRLKTEKLEKMEIHLLCIPLPSADAFRKAFLVAMGLDEE